MGALQPSVRRRTDESLPLAGILAGSPTVVRFKEQPPPSPSPRVPQRHNNGAKRFLWMSSHYSSQTSFDLHISMQMKRGTMAGVDRLPSRYLNYRKTKAWPHLHSNAPEGQEKMASQNNNGPLLWRQRCFFLPTHALLYSEERQVLHAEWRRRPLEMCWHLPPQAD